MVKYTQSKKDFVWLIINITNFDGKEELRRWDSGENVKLINKALNLDKFKVKDYCDLNDY